MSEPIAADNPPVTPDAFDRVLSATNDVGLDNTGQTDCTPALQRALNNGRTLVQFEPGTYRVDSRIACTTNGIGLRGDPDNPGKVAFVPAPGRTFNLLAGAGSYPNDLYVEGITIDRTDDWRRSIGLADGNWTDRVYIHNVRVPGNSGAGDQVLIWNIREKSQAPRVLVDGIVKRGPTEYTEYPQGEITIYNGPPTTGNITYRNLDLRNTTESAIYCGKDAADVHVLDSYFKNCMHTAIRVAGKGSSIRRCKIVLDLANQHPENRNKLAAYVRSPNNKQPQVLRGIWVFTNIHKREGPGVISDCDIYLARDDGYGHGDTATMDGTGGPHRKLAGILVGGDTGGTRIQNCRIHTDNRGATAIKAQVPNEYAAPYREVHVENCHILSTAGATGVDIAGRPGSSVTRTHVKHNSNMGVRVTGIARYCEVTAGEASVRATTTENIGTNPKPAPVNVAPEPSTPTPAPTPEPPSNPPDEPDPKPEPEPDPPMSTPDPTEYPNTAVVSSPTGETIDYRVTATGEIVADYDVERTDKIAQNDDGTWTAQGITGLAAKDAYRYKGKLVGFESRQRGTVDHYSQPGPGRIESSEDGNAGEPEPEPEPPGEPGPEPEPPGDGSGGDGGGSITADEFIQELRTLLSRVEQ